MRYESNPGVDKDYLEALVFYRTRWPQAALDFEAEFESLIERICEMPLMYQVIRQPDIRRAQMSRKFPYSIYFRVTGGVVEIIALSHHSRQQDYWLDRI